MSSSSSPFGLPGTAVVNLPPPVDATDGLRHSQPDTEAWIGARRLGVGVLMVAESRLAWTPSLQLGDGDGASAGGGFSLNYPAISMHGLAKGDAGETATAMSMATARPHLYLLVRGDLLGDDAAAAAAAAAADGDDSDGDDINGDDEEEPTTEVRFCPADAASLMVIFQAVSDCQTLHPDEDDTGDSEGEGDDDEDEDGHCEEGGDDGEACADAAAAPGPPPGASGDPHGGSHQPMDTDQFEDA